MKLRKILMGLAAVVGFTTAATAATPVAVWDGDFNETTKGSYTLTTGTGHEIAEGGSTITIGDTATAGVKVSGGDIYTIVVKASGYTPASTDKPEVIAAMLNGDNSYMGLGAKSDKKGWYIWNNAAWGDTKVTSSAIFNDTNSHKYTVSYTYDATGALTQGTTIYMDNTQLTAQTSLRGSDLKKATSVTIGGQQSGTSLTVAKGLVIEGIAIFDSSVSTAAAAAYKFPSDLTTHKSRVEAGGDWDWTALDWNPEVTDPASSKLELTIEATDALFTMDEDPNCYSLKVTGTMKIKVDAEGEDLAKKTVVGAPYADWLFKTTGAVTGTFEPVFNSALPAGYTASYEIVAGQGVRYVVTAPVWAKFGSVNINFAGGRSSQPMVDDSKVGSLTTLIGAQPIVGTSWNDLGAENQTDTVVPKYVKADGTVVEDANITLTASQVNNPYTSGAAANMLITGYMDDGGSPIVQIGNIPFAKYRVILYRATDTGSTTFSAAQIGTTSSDTKIYYGPTSGDETGGATVSGTTETVWGKSDWRSGYAEGVNYIVSDVLEGTAGSATAYIYSHKHAGRAGVAAIQIVEVGEVLAEQEYTATINEDKNWNDIQWSPEPTGGFPVNAKLVLTAEDSPTITFTAIENLDRPVVINGAVTLKAADALFTDGCWEKTIATFGSFVPGCAKVSEELPTGFSGEYTLTDSGFKVRAQNREVISINIGGGSLNYNTAPIDSPEANLVPADQNYYGVAPTMGETWNNIGKQWKNTRSTVTLEGSKAAQADGTVVERPTIDLSATATTTWQAGITNPFLRGYLDDGDGLEVAVHGVPYTKYDVIVYATSDATSSVLSPITVNGEQYTFVDGETVKGSTTWGKALCNVPAIGDNALYIKDCTGEQLTISAAKTTGGRGTLCAVQVINQGEILIRSEYYGEMDGDVVWTDGKTAGNLTQLGDDWVNGQLSTITITNKVEGANFSFGAETIGQQIKFVSEYPITIDAASMVEYGKLGIYDFTEVEGGAIFQLPEDEAFDAANLPTTIKGNWKFSEGGILVFDGTFPTATEQTLFQNPDAWTGTVWLKNVALAGTSLDNFCNANSILKFTGVTGWLRHNSAVQNVPTLELEDDGDTLAFEVTDSSQDKVYNFAKFTGDGTFRFATKAKTGCVMTITDVSEFTGKLLSTDGEGTTARPIFVGTDKGTVGTTSLISIADGATINAGCGWEAASAAFGATLNVVTGEEDDAIVSGLEMQAPVYLATKVLYPEEINPDFSCLGYEDDAILICKATEFLIDPGENATVTTVLGAFEDGSNYYAANEAPVQVTFTAKEGYLFPNGSTTLTVDAEAGEGATIEPTEQPVQAEAKIGDTYYLTLAAALDAAKDKDEIEVCKDLALTESLVVDKALTFNLAEKTITANFAQAKKTYVAPIFVTTNGNLTVTGNGTIAGYTGAEAAALDGKSIITVDAGTLSFVNGTLTAGGVGADGMYGIYVLGDGTVMTGTYGEEGGPTITTWFAAIGANNTTAPVTIYINGGTFTALATPAAGDWWHYFCAPIYASADGVYTIYGGTFNGNYCLSTRYANVEQYITFAGGTFNAPLLVQEEKGAGSTSDRVITKADGVEIDPPAGYLWNEGVLTKAEAKIGTTYYLTLQEALNVGGDVVMLADAGEVTVPAGKTVNLDFNGFAITTTSRQAINNYGRLTIENGNVTAQEAAIVLWGGSVTSISGGTYTSKDNAVIMGNGNAEQGDVALHITGGTFNGGIQTAGYIACGVYVANTGLYNIKGGTFNITGGCGICARAGEIKVASEAEFNLGFPTEPGKVGDSARLVPCVAMFTDYEAAYPGYAETDFLKAQDNTLTTADGFVWGGPDKDGYYTLTKPILPTVSVDEYEGEMPAGLDTAYTYTLDDKGAGYDDWNVDYFVSFDKDIAADTVTLKGQYTGYDWTGTTLPATTAGTEIQLVPFFTTKGVTVAEMAAMVTFNCGAGDTGANAGTTMTVTLKMFKDGEETIVLDTQTYTFEAKGPQPAPGSDVDVKPVPGAENTYTVEPTGESKDVTIQGVKDGDTLIIEGAKVDSLTFNTDVTPTVVVKNANGTTIPNGAFYGLSGNTFNATLDPNGEVDGVKVQPTIETSEEIPTPFVVGTDASTTIKSIPGLTYTLKRGTEIGTYADEADSKTADAATVTLTDDNKPADKAFYIIRVTK